MNIEIKACILEEVKIPTAVLRVAPVTDATPLRAWLSTAKKSPWIPQWVHPAIQSWPAVRVSQSDLDSLSITALIQGTDAASLKHIQQDIYPIVRAAYQVLSTHLKRKNGSPPPAAHIVYVACDKKRSLPAIAKVVEPKHINGGLTVFRKQQPDHPWRILVYRQEDAIKVILHELVHLFNVEGTKYDAAEEAAWARQNDIAVVAPIGRLEIAEAVVETVACYMYAVMYVSPQLTDIPKKLRIRAACEKLGDQMDRITHHLLSRAPPLFDGTHTFAYVVARSALWDGGNGPCGELFDYVDNESPVSELLHLLETRIPPMKLRLFGASGASGTETSAVSFGLTDAR
jgi:hypothetical protein